MASWIAYKGLDLPDNPTGDAGINLKSDLQALADRVGPCNFTATANPLPGNDITQGYHVGSLWLNTAAGSWWVCTNNSAGYANWLLLAPLPVFGPSGTGHSTGLVPDPGGSEGVARFLREDATWDAPVATEIETTDEGYNITFTNTYAAIFYCQIANGASSGTLSLPTPATGNGKNATLVLDNTQNGVPYTANNVAWYLGSIAIGAHQYLAVPIVYNGGQWSLGGQLVADAGKIFSDGDGNLQASGLSAGGVATDGSGDLTVEGTLESANVATGGVTATSVTTTENVFADGYSGAESGFQCSSPQPCFFSGVPSITTSGTWVDGNAQAAIQALCTALGISQS